MYSIEYKWTNVEIKVTTINMIEVNESKQKDQFTEIESEKIHELKTSLYVTSFKRISLNNSKEKIRDKKTLKVVKIQTPKPKNLPNKPPLKNPINGKKTIKKSIKL